MLDWFVLLATALGLTGLIGGFLLFITRVIEEDLRLQHEQASTRAVVASAASAPELPGLDPASAGTHSEPEAPASLEEHKELVFH